MRTTSRSKLFMLKARLTRSKTQGMASCKLSMWACRLISSSLSSRLKRTLSRNGLICACKLMCGMERQMFRQIQSQRGPNLWRRLSFSVSLRLRLKHLNWENSEDRRIQLAWTLKCRQILCRFLRVTSRYRQIKSFSRRKLRRIVNQSAQRWTYKQIRSTLTWRRRLSRSLNS